MLKTFDRVWCWLFLYYFLLLITLELDSSLPQNLLFSTKFLATICRIFQGFGAASSANKLFAVVFFSTWPCEVWLNVEFWEDTCAFHFSMEKRLSLCQLQLQAVMTTCSFKLHHWYSRAVQIMGCYYSLPLALSDISFIKKNLFLFSNLAIFQR